MGVRESTECGSGYSSYEYGVSMGDNKNDSQVEPGEYSSTTDMFLSDIYNKKKERKKGLVVLGGVLTIAYIVNPVPIIPVVQAVVEVFKNFFE